MFREAGDAWGLAIALSWLGVLGVVTVRLDEARVSLKESLRLFRALGDTWGLARVLNLLGEVARAEGADEGARALYEEALLLSRALGNPTAVATVLHNVCYIAQRQGDLSRAAAYFAEAHELLLTRGDKRNIAHALAGMAGMAGMLGHLEEAARLFGAAEALFDATGASMWPVDRIDHERNVALVRSLLGESTFRAAWEAGRMWPYERAVAEATALGRLLSATAGRTTTAQPSPSISYGLTRREGEVLRLLVDGRSDREIGDLLNISHRTVSRHMTGILGKLGVTSRTAAATLAVRQGVA